MTLKQYKKEWATFSDVEKRIITDMNKISKTANTISNRFCIQCPNIIFNKRFGPCRGLASRAGHRITVGEQTTLHTLAHELAHILTKQRFNKTGHNKLHYKWTARICHYIRKRNYFNIPEANEEHIKWTERVSECYSELKDPKFSEVPDKRY